MVTSGTCGDSLAPGDALTLFLPFILLPVWLLVLTFDDASASGKGSTCGNALFLPSPCPS